MKTKKLAFTLVVTLLMPAGMASAAESVSLFESPGRKQTAKDFKPAPAKLETSFGELNFLRGAFPTEESAQKIHDEIDLQRATQAYMDFYPFLSLYAIVWISIPFCRSTR
jgi:hypothetical protein